MRTRNRCVWCGKCHIAFRIFNVPLSHCQIGNYCVLPSPHVMVLTCTIWEVVSWSELYSIVYLLPSTGWHTLQAHNNCIDTYSLVPMIIKWGTSLELSGNNTTFPECVHRQEYRLSLVLLSLPLWIWYIMQWPFCDGVNWSHHAHPLYLSKYVSRNLPQRMFLFVLIPSLAFTTYACLLYLTLSHWSSSKW